MVQSFTEDFQVKWKDATGSDSTWTWDGMHFPAPIPPLSQEIVDAQALRALDVEAAWVNGYGYWRDFALPAPPLELERLGLSKVWFSDYRNQVQEATEAILNVDYESMASPRLAEELQSLFNQVGDAHRYTVVVVGPLWVAPSELADFCEREFGGEGLRLATTFLQGFDNESAAAGKALGDLAELARSYPGLAGALIEGNFDSVLQMDADHEFRRQFQDYLDNYGRRLETWVLYHKPTWREQPELALEAIARLLSTPNYSATAAQQRAVEAREQALSEAESRLEGEKLEEFRRLVEKARDYVAISEDRAYLQHVLFGSLRVPIGVLGHRFTASEIIGHPDDIYFLSLDEVKVAAKDPTKRYASLVTQRKNDLERWTRLTPAPFLGKPPGQPPPEVERLLNRFIGAGTSSVEGKTIKGQAASAGVVTGPARIVQGLHESDRVGPGDILVCRSTAPPWTPLFAVASGVVTDAGGVLSHSAICAREYAIPCVVATQVATTTIPDGAMVTVDGSKGLVIIEG
jgi:phosphohistidine swiveling domain-containing protein